MGCECAGVGGVEGRESGGDRRGPRQTVSGGTSLLCRIGLKKHTLEAPLPSRPVTCN